MSPTPRLLEIADALVEAGIVFLIMGGHAVRHYGVDRNTLDFDFHVSMNDAPDLQARLERTRLFSGQRLIEGAGWRRADFRRFQIGALPTAQEEWLEFWFRNHLLAPFPELYGRREAVEEAGRQLSYLSLPDLIRSKETERDDDWADVRLLEEILDGRHLAGATDAPGRVRALSQLRSRRGFERAEAGQLLARPTELSEAIHRASHAVSCAYLLPFVHRAGVPSPSLPLDPAVQSVLQHLAPGSARHLAVVEAVRLAVQRAAKVADQADKQRARHEQ
ncbi:MAG: hypothetical protein ACREUU_05860 [Gammaproteobacteria bacterium]